MIQLYSVPEPRSVRTLLIASSKLLYDRFLFTLHSEWAVTTCCNRVCTGIPHHGMALAFFELGSLLCRVEPHLARLVHNTEYDN